MRLRKPDPARSLHRIEYAALLAGVWLARAVPWRHCRRAARLLLPLAWPFLGRYRRTTESNLRLSDLDVPRSGAAFRRLVREVLVQALTTVIEAVKLSRMPREDILRHVVFDAEESWRKVWARSAGGIIAAGHLGNWELLGQAATCMGFPITAVARRQDNPLTDGYLNTARGRWGMRTLFRQDIALARQILDALRGRGIVVFLIDQRGGPKGVPTRFLGRACTTPRGAVQFALRAGVPVCFAYGLRDPDGTHRLFLDEPIEVCDDGRPRDEIERDVTQRLVARLESEVRRHPEQWFWFLDRWRTD